MTLQGVICYNFRAILDWSNITAEAQLLFMRDYKLLLDI